MCGANNWILFLVFAVIARGVEVVATRAEGECSANDESCVADDGVEPAEIVVLTECHDTEKDCAYWASLGEVSKLNISWIVRFFHNF